MDARDIIARWPSRIVLAADANRTQTTINSWVFRNSIPGDLDVVLVQAAKRRQLYLTYEELALARATA